MFVNLKMKQLFFLVILAGSFQTVFAQDLFTHQWENRLLLIFANSETNTKYLNQLKELENNPEGLSECKIKVYHFLQDGYYIGVEKEQQKKYTNNFHTSVEEKLPFIIQLIGLDGEVKFSSSTTVPFKTLRGLIDGMPMRKAEINKR